MNQDSQGKMRTPQFGPATTPVPSNVTVRKALMLDVFIGTSKKELIIRYDGGASVDLEDADPTGHFQRLVRELSKGSNPRGWRQKPTPYGTPPSSLSIRTNEWTYVAFRLTSNRSNLQFSSSYYPLTVASDASEMFYATGKVLGDGTITDANAPSEDCNTAFFVVDGTQFDAHGDSPRLHFNLHIDVTQDGGARIPIIIDPDVGYPQGIPRS